MGHAKVYIFVYALLALVILGPLLRPGYVLTLDMVFAPHLRMPDAVTSSYLFHAGLRLLNFVLPGDVIEKLVLLTIFWTAGVGAHRLVRSLQRGSAYDAFGAYVAGVCYAVNPFTYDRLMAGQYSVLLGYALLPFFVRALFGLLQRPSRQASVRVALWATLVSIVSIHMVGVMAILAVVGIVGECWHRRGKSSKDLWRFASIGAGLFVVLSSYWLVPLAIDKGTTAAEIGSFGRGDVSAFATTGWGLPGRLSNVLHLQGFWAEDRGLFALPQERLHGLLWGELSVLLLAVVVVGMVWAWRARRRFVLGFFGAAVVIGAVLALGALTPLTSHVRVLAGYREPQKFEALMALGYAVFMGFGAAALLRRIRRFMQSKVYAGGAAVVLLGVPFIFTSTLLWGAREQLTARPYPTDWTVANKLLNAEPGTFQTLFLPWHMYMYFGFAGRIAANPAPAFFDRPVIISDNPEFDGAALVQPTAAKRALDVLLPQASRSTTLGKQLAALHIKYVLLDRDDDYQKYQYLDRQSDLRRVFAGPDLVVYKNEDFR